MTEAGGRVDAGGARAVRVKGARDQRDGPRRVLDDDPGHRARAFGQPFRHQHGGGVATRERRGIPAAGAQRKVTLARLLQRADPADQNRPGTRQAAADEIGDRLCGQ